MQFGLNMDISDRKPEVIGPNVEYVSVTPKGTVTLDCNINGGESYSWSKLDKCANNSLKAGLLINKIYMIYQKKLCLLRTI